MKASRETKKAINDVRSFRGKKNGVVRWLYEDLRLEAESGKPKAKYCNLQKPSNIYD